MRCKIAQWLQVKAAPDATTSSYWIGAIWYFDFGWNLW